jgi:hypothetical protein
LSPDEQGDDKLNVAGDSMQLKPPERHKRVVVVYDGPYVEHCFKDAFGITPRQVFRKIHSEIAKHFEKYWGLPQKGVEIVEAHYLTPETSSLRASSDWVRYRIDRAASSANIQVHYSEDVHNPVESLEIEPLSTKFMTFVDTKFNALVVVCPSAHTFYVPLLRRAKANGFVCLIIILGVDSYKYIPPQDGLSEEVNGEMFLWFGSKKIEMTPFLPDQVRQEVPMDGTPSIPKSVSENEKLVGGNRQIWTAGKGEAARRCKKMMDEDHQSGVDRSQFYYCKRFLRDWIIEEAPEYTAEKLANLLSKMREQGNL